MQLEIFKTIMTKRASGGAIAYLLELTNIKIKNWIFCDKIVGKSLGMIVALLEETDWREICGI